MRVCVFGVGAVGSFVLARLTGAGVAASGVARGETLAAIRARGIRVIGEDGVEEEPVKPVRISADPAELGNQDVLFIAMKAHQVGGALDQMTPLIGPDTTVVSAVNGIPWWYFYGTDRDPQPHLETVDPGGRLWRTLGAERALGCVAYMGAAVPRPGVVRCTQPRLVLGEPDGRLSSRLTAIADVLAGSGIETRTVPDIRTAVWKKVLGNAWANPISVITGATAERICGDPHLRATLLAMMREVCAVAAAHGVTLDVDLERRIEETGSARRLQEFDPAGLRTRAQRRNRRHPRRGRRTRPAGRPRHADHRRGLRTEPAAGRYRGPLPPALTGEDFPCLFCAQGPRELDQEVINEAARIRASGIAADCSPVVQPSNPETIPALVFGTVLALAEPVGWISRPATWDHEKSGDNPRNAPLGELEVVMSKSVRRLTAILSALLATAALPAAANAQAAPPCTDRASLVDSLSDQYQEHPTSMGLSANGAVFEIFSSTTGSWTILVTRPDGVSCLMATGEGWENLPQLAQWPEA